MAISYRKKPVEIEAVRWTGENASEILDFIGDARETNFDPELSIKTLEGWHCASVGDYIIKGVHGEFYPCKPDVFEMSYVSMENGAVYISVIGDPDGGLAEGSVEGSEIDVITACLAILQALFCRSGDKKIIKDVITDMLPFVFDEDVKPRRRTKTAIK